ncbi:40S ribosomal protein [Arachis hypogaea]|nr:40S ribosomal protein [Arachis hypogaea]
MLFSTGDGDLFESDNQSYLSSGVLVLAGRSLLLFAVFGFDLLVAVAEGEKKTWDFLGGRGKRVEEVISRSKASECGRGRGGRSKMVCESFELFLHCDVNTIRDKLVNSASVGEIDLVKTARFKELAPYNPDWYFVRAVFNEPCPISHRLLVFLEVGTRSKVLRASMARKIYLRGGVGVGAFKRIYGGSQRNGSCPPHFCESSGAIARHILQPLESMTVIEENNFKTDEGSLNKLLGELWLLPENDIILLRTDDGPLLGFNFALETGDNKFLDIEISAEMLTTTNNGSAITCNGSAITCNYSVSKQMQRPSLNSCLGIKQTKLRAIKGLLLMRIFT